MGCDIHFYVEKRVDGRWVSADTWKKREYQDDLLEVPYGKSFYSNRNYDLFGILANVRNGSGFAGVDTGDGFVPIMAPRGLPDDLSPELESYVKSGAVDHTPTWLSVAELMSYDWTRVTTKRGFVNGPQFWEWSRWKRGDGRGPPEWCGGVGGSTIQHISMEEMETLISDIKTETKNDFRAIVESVERLSKVYCQVDWQIPYYRAADDFLAETLPRLWRLGEPENVRCVFWFDN